MSALHQLRSRKALAQERVRASEVKLRERFVHLEQNFGKMAMNSLLPMPLSQVEKFSGFFDGLNSTILKLMPSSISEEKRQKVSSNLKSAELLLAGFAYRYVKKLIGG
jgi:hypothetical protein